MNNDEIFDGYDGGGDLPADAVRSDLVAPQLVARSYLDKQLIRLLTLNPNLQLQFRNADITMLDESAKLQLLEEMRATLGLRSPVHEASLR